ncbi:hypothetical protein MT340_010045 [Staphylococcus sp. NRL 16/872]|uniref:hypothetical protein n=1 Tax=Staphylococcus sp. NRL 16/872 TaxID=2930131 RepID=UPI001FB283F2|nr:MULTISPECIES: hypothetical protein [unclassified Staphylococcus]MCJ1656873.1 hypothetical protein [Staphylococcus sp. NRL 21/187]MCJ1662620.1 hypothetical protein [Staphylococcus sp. NRL 18/288]MCJ1668722.1 hypothetical protein [Staphylococcus sp. NRL 19/737]WEN68938.1 hypothetical protein MT340_010045 [Staphylococcus sp. NRL 16/872]
MENQSPQSSKRERNAGKLIAYSSLIFSILLIIHNFIALDTQTAKELLTQAGQKTNDSTIANILNSFRYTGIMYILAYLAGVIALWNRHKYLWWFMFAVFVSNVLFTLVNLAMVINAIIAAKSALFIAPILIVIIGSSILALYMLVISIMRKSTFDR